MKIAILGFDVEGRASLDYFLASGHEVTICDQNADLEVPSGVQSFLGENYLDNLGRFDLIVRTAGMPPHKILDKNPGLEPKITTHINEFLKVCPTKNVIGVTGTKGKGTTSTLITRMLEATGHKVYLGGNIGLAPLTFLSELNQGSWVALELSSFQLVDLKLSPHIGICLMVVAEHLDWHPDLSHYWAAKTNLFSYQTEQDIAIYFSDNEISKTIASASPGQIIPYCSPPGAYVDGNDILIGGHVICQTTDLKLVGKHNWQNVCAALTGVWQVTQDVVRIKEVLINFSGLEHRLELVREVDGVNYYDDSFGTAPATAIVAIQAITAPKVIILGGSDKGANYQELAEVIAGSDIRRVLLIGEQASRIQAALESVGFTNYLPGGDTMDEIVANAKKAASAGDVVLLSPACASFDMFANYKDRGQQFKQAVQALR